MGLFRGLLLTAAVGFLAYVGYHIAKSPTEPPPECSSDGWFGRGERPNNVVTGSPRPFKIEIPDKILDDLRKRLDDSIFLADPQLHRNLEDVTDFTYGMRADVLREYINYWRNEYDWRAVEKRLNQYPQFLINIEGIDLHYVYVKAKAEDSASRPTVLLIHGWPGSFYEFFGVIPELTEFNLVVPSLPGFAFSERAHRSGVQEYFIQGGDWGSFIVSEMGRMFPKNIAGAHSNLPYALGGPVLFKVQTLLEIIAPRLLYDEKDLWKVGGDRPGWGYFSMLNEYFSREVGYFMIQATKPDTVGIGLTDSPVGLAAYILEKFSTWTNRTVRQTSHGGLVADPAGRAPHLPRDHLITNVMIYWLSQSILSSQRIYKEFFESRCVHHHLNDVINVPFGFACYRYELGCQARSQLAHKFSRILHYADFDNGGHFAALQLPSIFANDLKQFLQVVRRSSTQSATS